MTLIGTMKYAVVITFFAVLWATTFEIATHRPLMGAVAYWSVGVWGFLVFLIRVLKSKMEKGK